MNVLLGRLNFKLHARITEGSNSLYRYTVIIPCHLCFQGDCVICQQPDQQNFHESVSYSVSHTPSRANPKATQAFAHVRCFVIKSPWIESVSITPDTCVAVDSTVIDRDFHLNEKQIQIVLSILDSAKKKLYKQRYKDEFKVCCLKIVLLC